MTTRSQWLVSSRTVASGGALDVGFIPLWLGLVTATGVIPPAYGEQDPAGAMATLVDHALAAGTFTAPLLLGAMSGGEPSLDGDFYAQRSPINVIDRVEVPAFFISGQYDLFQRGTPLLFENLLEALDLSQLFIALLFFLFVIGQSLRLGKQT